MTDKCRAEFEAFCSRTGRGIPCYKFPPDLEAWNIWQAAWEAYMQPSYVSGISDSEWLALFRMVAKGAWTPETALQHIKEDVPQVVSAAPINQAYEG